MRYEGKDTDRHLEPRKKCPKCKKKGYVYYRGSEILQGNPFTSATNSEIKHLFECENCGLRFAEIVKASK